MCNFTHKEHPENYPQLNRQTRMHTPQFYQLPHFTKRVSYTRPTGHSVLNNPPSSTR